MLKTRLCCEYATKPGFYLCLKAIIIVRNASKLPDTWPATGKTTDGH